MQLKVDNIQYSHYVMKLMQFERFNGWLEHILNL
jgi:hypothetical protein